MSGLGNKEIFSHNLQRYILKSGKERKEIALALGVSYSTFTDWVNGNKYPRIDKIEMLADYFGIKKSDLIEEYTGQSELSGLLPNSPDTLDAAADFGRQLFAAHGDLAPEDYTKEDIEDVAMFLKIKRKRPPKNE